MAIALLNPLRRLAEVGKRVWGIEYRPAQWAIVCLGQFQPDLYHQYSQWRSGGGGTGFTPALSGTQTRL